jgi:hypothetical protein
VHVKPSKLDRARVIPIGDGPGPRSRRGVFDVLCGSARPLSARSSTAGARPERRDSGGDRSAGVANVDADARGVGNGYERGQPCPWVRPGSRRHASVFPLRSASGGSGVGRPGRNAPSRWGTNATAFRGETIAIDTARPGSSSTGTVAPPRRATTGSCRSAAPTSSTGPSLKDRGSARRGLPRCRLREQPRQSEVACRDGRAAAARSPTVPARSRVAARGLGLDWLLDGLLEA